jgi:hypothetical protein
VRGLDGGACGASCGRPGGRFDVHKSFEGSPAQDPGLRADLEARKIGYVLAVAASR